MGTNRVYRDIKISKTEAEFIKFILSGSNNFTEAYFQYENRKKRIDRNVLTICSWFNKTLRGLKDKRLILEIPYVLRHPKGFIWSNPGIRSNRDSFVALTLQIDNNLTEYELKKII